MDPLILEAAEPTLRRSVISAVSLTAHRTHHAVFPQEILENPSGIMADILFFRCDHHGAHQAHKVSLIPIPETSY